MSGAATVVQRALRTRRRGGLFVARTLAGVVLLFGALACGGSEESDESESRRPTGVDASGRMSDVILITWDTVRADAVGESGANGSTGTPRSATPTFDRLAREGVAFSEARSPVPITLPAHASLLSGLWPSTHGVRDNGLFRVEADVPLVTSRFKEAGYATGAFVSAAVLDRRYGLARDFDVYDDRVARHGADMTVPTRPASVVVDAAIAWLDSVAPDRRVFLWVHLYDPHRLWRAPEPWATRFADPYRAEIAYADAETGRLLDALAERERLDTAVVVLTSDHGEGLGEHGEETHAYFAYDSTLRVPLVLWTGEQAPHRIVPRAAVPGPASLVDLAPTLLELAGLPAQSDVAFRGEGRSLVAALDVGRVAPRLTPIECVAPAHGYSTAPVFGLVTEDRQSWYDLPERERYDLEQDPHQLTNLYRARDAARADALFARVDWRWPPDAPMELDAATRRQLAALGYLVDEAADLESDVDPKARVELANLLTVNRHRATPERALEAARALEAEHGLLPALARFEVDLLDALGRPVDALEVLERAAEEHPSSASLAEDLAARRRALADQRSLARAIRDALAKDPAHPSARRDLALTLHRLQQLEEAEGLYRAELERAPAQTDLRLNLARLLVARGEHAAALEVVEAGRAARDYAPRLDCEAARLLGWYLGRKAEARSAMVRCADAGATLGEMDRALLHGVDP